MEEKSNLADSELGLLSINWHFVIPVLIDAKYFPLCRLYAS